MKRPEEPQLHDTVKASETAFEGDVLYQWSQFFTAKWYDDRDFDGLGEKSAPIDYLIGIPLAFFAGGILFETLTTFVAWERTFIWTAFVGLVALASGVFGFIGLMWYHQKTHKYISMVVANRYFRKDWVARTRLEDEGNYREAVETYDQRVKDYLEAREQAVLDAAIALEDYHSTSPEQRFKVGAYGLEPASS